MFLFRRIWTTASESSRVEAFLELHGAHENDVQNWYVETGEHILIKSYTPIKQLQFTIWDGQQIHTNTIKLPTSTASKWTYKCQLVSENPRWNLHDAQNAHKKDGIGWEGWNLRTSKPFWASNSWEIGRWFNFWWNIEKVQAFNISWQFAIIIGALW